MRPEGSRDDGPRDDELRLVEPGRDTPPSAAPGAPDDPHASVLTDHIEGMDLEDVAEPAPESSDDPPELVAVRHMTRAMAKAVKAVRLYPMQNPMCLRFAEDLSARLTETFQLLDTIRLTVGKTKLFFSGEVVLDQVGREDSVPGRLFWDGIREITLHVGLTRTEMVDFLKLFRVSSIKGADGEDDFVTLLWEGSFEHVTHIAVDDLLDLESADDPVPEEFGHEFMNYVDLEMHNLEDDEEIDQSANEIAEEIRARINADDDPELFGITPEEREALETELAEEESPKMLSDVVEILFQTLLLEDDEESFIELVQVLSGALLSLMGEGRLREAAEVVRMLRELKAESDRLNNAMRAAIDSGLKASWDGTRRQAMIRHLDAGRPSAFAALSDFMKALPSEAVRPMVEVLGHLETRRSRRHLIDALIEKAEGNVAYFTPFIGDERWYLVRNVAQILGATRNETAVGPLKELLRHPDFRVRREALIALSRVGRGSALDVLTQALYDDDQRIRTGAARNLAVLGRRALPALLTVVEEKDFEKRDLSEKRVLYEALGCAGGKEVLPLVEQALARRNFLFRKGQADEMRACACEALGWIGGERAKALLARHLEDKSVIVRTAAQSGMRRASGERNVEQILKEAA